VCEHREAISGLTVLTHFKYTGADHGFLEACAERGELDLESSVLLLFGKSARALILLPWNGAFCVHSETNLLSVCGARAPSGSTPGFA